jgi:hypothetical protein
VRLALLTRKRATVVRLRDERRIDDIVLRQIQVRLDIEDVRLARGQPHSLGAAFLRAGEEQPDDAVGVGYVFRGERLDIVRPAVNLRCALWRGARENKPADQPWADEGQFPADVAAERESE